MCVARGSGHTARGDRRRSGARAASVSTLSPDPHLLCLTTPSNSTATRVLASEQQRGTSTGGRLASKHCPLCLPLFPTAQPSDAYPWLQRGQDWRCCRGHAVASVQRAQLSAPRLIRLNVVIYRCSSLVFTQLCHLFRSFRLHAAHAFTCTAYRPRASCPLHHSCSRPL